MTPWQFICPQCEAPFHFGDGYPDLYEIRLCSTLCLGIWLERYAYSSTIPDEHPGQMLDRGLQQAGDGPDERIVQINDLIRLEDPGKQME